MSNSYLSLVMVSASTSFFSSNATSSCMGKRNLILVFSYFIWDKSGYLSRTASNSPKGIFCTLIIPKSTFDYHRYGFFPPVMEKYDFNTTNEILVFDYFNKLCTREFTTTISVLNPKL